MVLDEALEERIWAILQPLRRRWPELDEDAIRASNRKQAVVPEGATILEPVGTAPGLVVPPASGEGPTVVVLPGPPRELQPLWRTAQETEAFQHAVRERTVYREGVLRLFGIPESEIAATLRAAEDDGVPLDQLEVTTCLRRGEIEVSTRYEPPAQDAYERFVDVIRARHGNTLFSDDGSTIDEQIAGLLKGPPVRTVATAESCTAGLLAARLTERPGSSDYVLGGVVVYSNEAKVEQAGVDPALIERHGAVSPEVAEALATGAVTRFGADLGIGVTGIAGPDGGTRREAGGDGVLLGRRARGPAPDPHDAAARQPLRRARPQRHRRPAPAAPRAPGPDRRRPRRSASATQGSSLSLPHRNQVWQRKT